MSRSDQIIGWAKDFNDGLAGFDYVDRFIVFFFMVITMVLFIYTLSQQLTPADQAEIAPAIELISYLPLIFLAWPIIRTTLTKLASAAINRWHPGVGGNT